MITIKIGPCPIQIHFTCFALLAFCCIFTGMGGGALCFTGVILHEFAHLGAMMGLGAVPVGIYVSALGCRIVLGKRTLLPDWKHIVISLAGPAANLLTFLTSFFFGQRDSLFAMVNLGLGLIHSLPIEPLDGGLAFHYALRGWLGEERAGRITRLVSVLFLIPIAVLGFLVLLQTQYNYSLLALSVYLMLYLVLGKEYAAF